MVSVSFGLTTISSVKFKTLTLVYQKGLMNFYENLYHFNNKKDYHAHFEDIMFAVTLPKVIFRKLNYATIIRVTAQIVLSYIILEQFFHGFGAKKIAKLESRQLT